MNGKHFNRLLTAPLSVAMAVCTVSLCGPAFATGFFIDDQSAQGLGRANAGNTTAADELGTIFFNPAGLTQYFQSKPGDNIRAAVGIFVIYPQTTIRNTGTVISTLGTGGATVPVTGRDSKNPITPAPVMNLYVAKNFGRLSLGAAVNAPPFGLANYAKNDWFGRYDAFKARLVTLNLGVVGSYEITHDLSVGGGIDLQYAETKLVQALPSLIAAPSPATDGRAELIGHAWTPGYNIGALYDWGTGTRIGAHYRSMMKHDIEGSATTSGLGAGIDGRAGAHAELNLPAVATVGISQAVQRLTLFGEFEWDGWHSFREIETKLDNGFPPQHRPARYRDSYGIALGAEYPLDYAWWKAVRGGIHYETTPTTDDFRDTIVTDSNRVWLGIGSTFRLGDNIAMDVAYNHAFFQKGKIARTDVLEAGAATVLVNADIISSIDTVAVGIRWTFD